jgi:hypothetical protein
MFDHSIQIGRLRCTGVRLGGGPFLLALEKKKNLMGDIKRPSVLSRRTGVAKINSQGGKYTVKHGTPSILISGKWLKNKMGTRERLKKYPGGKI